MYTAEGLIADKTQFCLASGAMCRDDWKYEIHTGHTKYVRRLWPLDGVCK